MQIFEELTAIFDVYRNRKYMNKHAKLSPFSASGSAEETGSDRILAFSASPSGTLLALTDDNKRLVLFSCEPSWRCISTRCSFSSAHLSPF